MDPTKNQNQSNKNSKGPSKAPDAKAAAKPEGKTVAQLSKEQPAKTEGVKTGGAPAADSKKADSEMAAKLAAAGAKAETEAKERRAREVKGSHLLQQMLDEVKKAGLTVEEKTGFHKVTAGPDNKNGRQIYIARKGGRVDLSGFTLENNTAVEQISEEKAREVHLGKVRGQLKFDLDDATVMSTFKAALKVVAEKLPEKAKPAKEKAKAEEQKQDATEAASIAKTEGAVVDPKPAPTPAS